MEVDRVTTPLSRAEMAEALIAGHKRYFGGLPSLQRLSVAWAQCALEHAAGAKLYNFNFGNVTAGPAWDGDVYVMHVPPPDPPVLRFRAFPSAELGAVDYWRMLDGHYRPALRLFDMGNAWNAAYTLGELGYFTAPKNQYANGVEHYKTLFDHELAAPLADLLQEGRGNSLLTPEEIGQVVASQIPYETEDPILEGDPRDEPTDPNLSTLPPTGADEGGKA